MVTTEFIVRGTQTELQRLLITLTEEGWKKRAWAFFQIFNEDQILTVKLPLAEVKEKLKQLKPDRTDVIRGSLTADYLLMTVANQGIMEIELTAVRGGARCLSAKFMADNLKFALELATDT